jgi:fluoride ion exporter CrcB/FEX
VALQQKDSTLPSSPFASSASHPPGTLAINASGWLLTGAAVGGLVDRLHTAQADIGIVTGFLVAYTTFSTFVFETHDLVRAATRRSRLAKSWRFWAASDRPAARVARGACEAFD